MSSVAGPDNPVEAPADEFGTFLDDVSRTLAAVVETAPWRRRVAETILRWEGEGIRTLRLEEALLTDAPADIDTLLDTFSRDATRLVQIRAELREYGIEDLPDNPTDLAGAESLLNAVRIARNGADAALQTRVAAAPVSDPWFLNREKVVLDWVDLDGRLVEDPR